MAPALQWHSTGHCMANDEYDAVAYTGVAADFEALLDSSPNERAVQTFLKRYRYIVRNALNVHAWNSVHLQPEFSLGGNHVVDFLILSEDSGGWHTVLIELESPNERPFTKKGIPAKALAKGLAQLGEWKIWIGKNDPSFREHLSSLVEVRYLPEEPRSPSDYQRANPTIRDPHTMIDKHYIVVVGRRRLFCGSNVQERRQQLRDEGKEIVSYDRLLDKARELDPSRNASR